METYWWWNKDFAAKGWKCSWQIFVEGRGKIFKKMREWLCWLARWEFSADCFASAPSKELYAANGRGFSRTLANSPLDCLCPAVARAGCSNPVTPWKTKSSFTRRWKSFLWSEWRDSNPRPLGPEPSALPTALHPEKKSAATLLLRWLGMRESNSHKRSQSPSHYHYANPHCMFVKRLCFRAALNA